MLPGHADPKKVLYGGAAIGFSLFVAGIALASTLNGTAAIIVSVSLEALGAAILFPIVISFAYDALRERWLGDEVWRLFGELADAGIARVYGDREMSARPDNAQARLSEDFRSLESGEVLMLGVTLRVFFNPLGPFYRDIETMLRSGAHQVHINALVSRADSPEVAARSRIEQPNREDEEIPQIERDIESSLATVRGMIQALGPRVTMRQFMPAPYCTAVVFPHIAYFSPNILAPEAPVRLPMILFRADSHGYKMIRASFDHLWNHGETVHVAG